MVVLSPEHLSTDPPPLKDEVLRNAKELPVIPIEPIPPPETSKPSNDKGSSSGGRTLGFGGDKGKVIPKWMKLPTSQSFRVSTV